jgi:hypothetical protein
MPMSQKSTPDRPRRSSSSKDPVSGESQRQRFIETARELGCDEDEAAFEEKLRRIATAKTTRRRKAKHKKSEC